MRVQGVADDFDERIKGHVVPLSQIQHTLWVFDWWGRVVQQRPAAVKDHSTNVFRHVQARNVGGAQGRHHEHELQVRQSGMINVESLHNRGVS